MSEFLSTVIGVSAIDPTGKKFDIVSRLVGKSIDNDISVELDYNSDILNIKTGDEVSLYLSFSETGAPQFGDYTYGMNGRLFKIEESSNKTTFYVSFGGLLLKLDCPSSILSKVKTGTNCKLYLKSKLV